MKLLRYGTAGSERPSMLDRDGTLRDLSAVMGDIDGAVLAPDTIARLRALHLTDLPRVPGEPRLGPCIASVGNFICIGLNYADHAAESGMTVPADLSSSRRQPPLSSGRTTMS